jgi:hypothetical protein
MPSLRLIPQARRGKRATKEISRSPLHSLAIMRITHLWRYPVKSFAGEPLTEVRLDRGGMQFDRRYVIIDGDPLHRGKALTARLVADLLAHRATVVGDAIRVQVPDGRTFAMDGAFSSYLASALSRPVSIEVASVDGEPFHDAHDILVLSDVSVRALEEEWGAPVNPLRFRPNIMLDGDGLAPYGENDWVGRRFKVGDAILEGAALDQRCVLTTIDPETLVKDPSFLRFIVERHDKCFGLYCRVLEAGKIGLGDEWIAL